MFYSFFACTAHFKLAKYEPLHKPPFHPSLADLIVWSFDQIIVLLKHLPYAQLQAWCRFIVKSVTASCSVTETGTWKQLQNKNTRLHCTTHFCCFISVFDLSVQRWIKALLVPACSLAKGTFTLFVWRSNCTIPFWSLINKSTRYLQILWWHVGIFGFFWYQLY